MGLQKASDAGAPEMKRALAASRALFWHVALFSVLVNLLMLTGPIYMLQVYDRVLASRSLETLTALSLLAAALYAAMGLLDFARARVLSRAGARFQEALDARVFEAVLRRSAHAPERSAPSSGMRDLEAVQRALSGPAPFAFFDAPWAPLFLGLLALFHWSLGVLAFVGGAVLLIVALLNARQSREPLMAAAVTTAQAETLAETLRREGETIEGLGMRDAAVARWDAVRGRALDAQILAADVGNRWSTLSKTLRFVLQSAMLGLGAWLAVAGAISPGVMIAGSVLLGRALAPVEQAVGQWSVMERAFSGWTNLKRLLATTPPPADRVALPPSRGIIEAQSVTVTAPGSGVPLLRGLTFRVDPGQALGVVGPSASGKSSLARVLTGIWRPVSGVVRLDGASLDQFDHAERGRRIGYLPQDIALMDGTVAEAISRFAQQRDDGAVVEAARRAGAHEMILGLPDGYDTQIGPQGAALSGGQRQRLGLARALYGDPAVVVLDEPNAHLDADGEIGLVRAISALKDRGCAVVVMAHRPSVLGACDLVLVLQEGSVRAFGPRDEVLRASTAQGAGPRQVPAGHAPAGSAPAVGAVSMGPGQTHAAAGRIAASMRGDDRDSRSAGRSQ